MSDPSTRSSGIPATDWERSCAIRLHNSPIPRSLVAMKFGWHVLACSCSRDPCKKSQEPQGPPGPSCAEEQDTEDAADQSGEPQGLCMPAAPTSLVCLPHCVLSRICLLLPASACKQLRRTNRAMREVVDNQVRLSGSWGGYTNSGCVKWNETVTCRAQA